jgi:electron transfer flavoprotein beta subunit
MGRKVLVAVKRVVDYNVKVRLKSDSSGVELEHVKMSMNPFDEIALEEAIRLKEAGHVDEIIVVSVGTQASLETIRTGLALGADRGLLIETSENLEPLHIAKILQQIAQTELIDLVFLGKQTIDGDNNQTAQMLAGLLDWPQGTFASKLVLQDEKLYVTREIDGGLETLALQLPAVVSADLRLNEPRYASLPNIMKAKKKQLDIKSLESLGLSIKPRQKILKFATPPTRKAGVKVATVDELLSQLRETGVIS